MSGGNPAVLGIAAAWDEGAHRVADFESGICAHRRDHARDFEAENRRCAGGRRILALALQYVGSIDAGGSNFDDDLVRGRHRSRHRTDLEHLRPARACHAYEAHVFRRLTRHRSSSCQGDLYTSLPCGSQHMFSGARSSQTDHVKRPRANIPARRMFKLAL